MNGTERYKDVPVRVLRQRFRMSGALSKDVTEIVPPQERPTIIPRLALYSTKKAYVDLAAYNNGNNELNHQLFEAKRRIFRQAAERAFYLSDQVEVKLFDGKGVRLQVHLRDQAAFNALVRNYDAIPSVLPSQEPFDHFLHVDIRSLRLMDAVAGREAEVAEALGKAFTDPYEGRLRQVTPAEVITDGYDEIRRVPVPEDGVRERLPKAS